MGSSTICRQALNLLLGGRPQIVRGDHGSEPARRGDRLKSSDASADDENARGRKWFPPQS